MTRVTMTSLLKCGASKMVLGAAAAAALLPSAALAQDQAAAADQAVPMSAETDPAAEANPALDAGADENIIVTGTRRALNTSQGIKRNADTVVDSITATDIGAFPDKSVAEALQRVPGITVNRFAASDDTSHFSAEPSGVLVRGLGQVRSEYNGRDTFSANSSRGLSWGDISPELMAGVDTYKNQTADMIEGGIAGSINLRTRVPFDANGQLIQGTINVNYGDISKQATPEWSAFYSNRWETGLGEFGLMGNYAFSRVQTASQGVQYGRMGIFDGVYAGTDTAYIPASISYRDNVYDRERNGFALAGQWRDLDRKFLVTAQFNRSTYENKWSERAATGYLFDLFAVPVDFRFTPTGQRNVWIPRAAQGTPAFAFDEDGNFQTGIFNVQQTDTGWWGADQAASGAIAVNESGEAMLIPCYNWQATCANPFRANEIGTATRYNENRNMTQDAALNLKWKVSDRLNLNLDAQHVKSSVNNYDAEVGIYSFANVGLDATGGLPRMTLLAPTNINQSAGGLSNSNNYHYNHVMDHIEDSDGRQFAFRIDGEYDFDSDWLDSVKIGGRYADREQTVRYSRYNWGNITNNWNLDSGQAPYWNVTSSRYPAELTENRPFGADYFGGNLSNLTFFRMDALKDRRMNELSYDALGFGQDQWRPICDRTTELADSCFQQVEIADVSERVKSAYAMVRFGGENARVGGLRVSGNFGLRYIETKNESAGYLAYPEAFVLDRSECDGVAPPAQPGQPTSAVPDPVACYLSADDLAFTNDGGAESIAKATHHHFLPSFNLRVNLSDKWLVRFAASRAMSRPDIGLMKNYVEVNATLPSAQDATDPRWVRNAAGTITGVNPSYTANAFNPYLKPTTATQFDLSIENYFAEVGSFSLALFYKKFQNYIQYGSYTREVTRGDVTRAVDVRGPMNGQGAEVRGFEVAYQRFFDFLPQPLDGLGIQANYTFVDNKGITNANLRPTAENGGDTTVEGAANSALEPGALEGLSKHSFNLVGMYEKGPIAARLAYNWRSSYLVTAVDCCVYLPMWQKSSGYLDASLRYALNDNIELSIQGSNLLNTKAVLRQQVTDESSPGGKVLVPGSWFQNDRRFVFGSRFRF